MRFEDDFIFGTTTELIPLTKVNYPFNLSQLLRILAIDIKPTIQLHKRCTEMCFIEHTDQNSSSKASKQTLIYIPVNDYNFDMIII